MYIDKRDPENQRFERMAFTVIAAVIIVILVNVLWW